MRVTCPNCCESYPIGAGFADDDGKRLAVLFADMEPVLGRAVISYLRLFRPAKSALTAAHASHVVEALLVLVRTGSVSRDEHGGMRRPAPPALWAAGIEQLLATPGRLSLPLVNHQELRAVVFGLADQAGALAERVREDTRRNTPGPRIGSSPQQPAETPLAAKLAWYRSQREYGAIDVAEYERLVSEAKATGRQS